MTESDLFIKILETVRNLLQSSDISIQQSAAREIQYNRSICNQQIIDAYLKIIVKSEHPQYRKLCVDELKLCMSDISSSISDSHIVSSLQENVVLELIQAINQEKDKQIQNTMANVIEEVAQQLLSAHSQTKFNFKAILQSQLICFLNPDNLTLLILFEKLLKSFPKYFRDLKKSVNLFLKIGLQHPSIQINQKALLIFLLYLKEKQLQLSSDFQEISPKTLKAVNILIRQHNHHNILNEFVAALNDYTFFFSKNIRQMIEMLIDLFFTVQCEKLTHQNIISILVKCSLDYLLDFPKGKAQLQQIIQIFFSYMIRISDQIPESWMRPLEGESSVDQNQKIINFSIMKIDFLIYYVKKDDFILNLVSYCEKMLKNPDWRYKYSSLMILSQIGEYTNEVSQISEVMSKIVSYLTHDNPKLRYAACHAIGQISDDMQPKLQKQLGQPIFISLISILLNDPVPRVVSHSAAALTNFIQGMSYIQIADYVDILMSLLHHLAVNGILLVKEVSVNTIFSTVHVMKQHFQPYLDSTLQILLGYFLLEQYQSKIYNSLKQQTFETIMKICGSVGLDNFRPFFNKLITILEDNIRQWSQNSIDPTKFFKSWQRLCQVFGTEMKNYFPLIYPNLLKLLERIILIQGNKQNRQQQNETKKNENNEKIDLAIQMFNVIIPLVKEIYKPFINQTFNLLRLILKMKLYQKTKKKSCKCFKNLITEVKQTNVQQAGTLIRDLMIDLANRTEDIQSMHLLQAQFDLLKQVLKNFNLCFLSEDQINQFSKKMLYSFNEAEPIIQDSNKQQKKTNAFLENLQLIFAQVAGHLIKTHTTRTLSLAYHLLQNVLTTSFLSCKKQNLNFGLKLINNMVEYLGYQALRLKWKYLTSTLLAHIQEIRCDLRKVSTYGLSVLVEKTPAHVLREQNLTEWLKILSNTYNIRGSNYSQSEYTSCCENIVATMGNIIKVHSDPLSCADFKYYQQIWISRLPINQNIHQALVQHEILIDFLLKNIEFMSKIDFITILGKLIIVITKIIERQQLYNKVIAHKINQFINMIKTNFPNQVASQRLMKRLEQWQIRYYIQYV